MKVFIYPDKASLGKAAAEHAAASIKDAITKKGHARIIAATGASQFDFLAALVSAPGIDWQKVEMFHLDEYVGLPISHPASFRKYLLERLIKPAAIGKYHLLDGEGDVEAVMCKVGKELGAEPVDVAFVGIGENGHLAFNDPPADFETEKPYILVQLDDRCRGQQLGEGWFKTLNDVPKTAISMSIRQILKANEILCIVPEDRKAEAVHKCFEGEVSPDVPASILRTHPKTTVFLDQDSAGQINKDALKAEIK